jgi:hypothetical protein
MKTDNYVSPRTLHGMHVTPRSLAVPRGHLSSGSPYPLPQNIHRAIGSFKSAQQPQRDSQLLNRTCSWLQRWRKELTSLKFQGFELRDYVGCDA